MKRTALYGLAAGLVLVTGCSKKEKPAPEAPEKTAIEQTKSVTQDLTAKAENLTEQTKAAAQELSQKTQTVVQELIVKKDDVMNELARPVADIKAKVESLKQPELLTYATAYKDVLVEKKDQLAGLSQQLKALPIGDLLGEKGKALKEQVGQYTSQFNALKERYSIYLDKLKALGVDLSAFGI